MVALVHSKLKLDKIRIIRLENGLKATLVSDPKSDKAAASLDVAVGHLDDPVSFSNPSLWSCLTDLQREYPGLAHFCEHLLFMVSSYANRRSSFSSPAGNGTIS